MRTKIIVDDEHMAAAQKISRLKTKKEVLEDIKLAEEQIIRGRHNI